MQKSLGIDSTCRIHTSLRYVKQVSGENKGPSLGKIQVKIPSQRSPSAMKFEDRSQEETERQQRCARSKAWNLAKNIYKLKEKYKATMRDLQQVQWLRVAGD